MVINIEPQAEVLPGYRLLERLGSGGFGEVWKAEAPGGLLKAIKIVHGDMSADHGDDRAEQELSALKRVQAVRHPYLLSIDRYDIVDGRLVIVTELADCNLWDRYQEFRNRRLPGIPREDLLRYLLEAAEVLDLMNTQHQLQHLDIKPQNLFLVHDHVKVADFGLVRDLDTVRSESSTTGATPVYAAPETFEGSLSPFSDQYSLAVVYQELLTGKRPFQAANMQQLIAQHLQAAPDLAALPPTDRPVIARALSKRPDTRHPSCLALIRALIAGGSSALPQSPPSAPPSGHSSIDMPAPVSPTAWRNETPATQMVFRREDDSPASESKAPRPAPPEQTGDGVLIPAMIVAIGQIGLEVLQRVRLSLVDRFGQLDRIPTLRLLFVDTDPDAAYQATTANAACPLAASETFTARLNRPGHYLKPRRNGRSIIEGWFDPQLLYRIKAANPQTQGLRPLGRLAFCDHFRALEQKLRDDLEAILAPATMDHAESHSQLGLRSNRPRVYIVAALGGGTGGGMFIDVAYAVRHRLKLLGYSEPDVVGVFLLPPLSGPGARPLATANAYAALTELNHFCVPGITYTACIDDRDVTLLDQAPPFRRFSLLPIRSPDPQRVDPVGIGTAADFLWRDLFTPFGRAADETRDQVMALPGVTPEPMTIAGQTFGLKAISWPRRLLLDRTSRWLCHRILANWVSADARLLREPVMRWVDEQWEALQLGPDSLQQVLRDLGDHALGCAPEDFVNRLTEPFQPKSRWSRSIYDPAAAFQVLNQLVQTFGVPAEAGATRQQGSFDAALTAFADAAHHQLSAKLTQVAFCLIEQPDFRLAGAEEAVLGLQEKVAQTLAYFEPMVRQRHQQAEQAYLRAQAILEEDSRRKSATELAENLRTFGISRYHTLVGRFGLQVYSRLKDELGDSLKQVTFCRQRLSELREGFHPGPGPETPPGTLLPEGCQSIEDAVEFYLKPFDTAALRDLDRQIQAMIEQQFSSLAQLCLTSSEMLVNLEAAILLLGRRFMQQRLGEADVAEMFLARNADPDVARRRLAHVLTEAEPLLEAPDSPRDAVEMLAVPVGDATKPFLQLVEQSLPNTQLTVTASPDDIVFYREQVTVPLKSLPHLNRSSQAVFEQLTQQQVPLHTRTDIRQWYRPDMM